MKSSSPRRAAARSRALSRRASTLAALGLSALALGPVAAAQASPTPTPGPSTWSGLGTPDRTDNLLWSDPGNWDTTPVSGSSLDFPALPHPCGTTGSCNNDILSGTSFSGLTIDAGSGYQLTGNAFGLGGGGITATSTNQTSSSIENDITLTAPQTWSLSGTSPVLILDGQVTGAQPLEAHLDGSGLLWLGGSADVGAVTLTGQDSSRTGYNAGGNGSLIVNESLNGTSHGAINATDIEIDAEPSNSITPTVDLGPLTLIGSQLRVGSSSTDHAGTVNTPSVSLDSASNTGFYLGAGAAAGTSYSQLNVSGDAQLNGSLQLSGTGSGPSNCSVPAVGSTDTIVQATGTLSGSFTDVPQDAIVEIQTPCDTDTSATARIHYDYAAGTVTATALNASTTAVALPATPSRTNQTATLTATVSPAGGTPTGTVEFQQYGSDITGCAAVGLQSDNTAVCSTRDLIDGGNVSATFNPNTSSPVSGSTSADAHPSVAADPTATSLTASHQSVTAGQSVTYTASVTPADSGPYAPGGAVRFMDGSTPIDCGTGNGIAGEYPDQNNQSRCTITYPSAGVHSVTAVYGNNDPMFAGSTSPSVSVTVVSATPAPAPTPKPTPAPAPAPAGTGAPSIGHATTSGATASLPVGCAMGGPSCTITVQITATELMQGGKIVGVIARKELTRKAIVLGSTKITLAPGQHKTLKITLNRTGRSMLATHKHLNTKLTVTRKTGGKKTKTVTSKTVSFKSTKTRH